MAEHNGGAVPTTPWRETIARYPALGGHWNDLVVLCGSAAWDSSPLGSHFLAEALAKHVPVLYVDPPVSAYRVARSGQLAREIRGPRLQRVGDALARVRAVAPPGKDQPGVRVVTESVVRKAIGRSVRALGGNALAVISGPPRFDPFGTAKERHRIFRASDDFAAGHELVGTSATWLEARERRLASRADVVVCVSPVLLEKWRRAGHRPTLIPNGCDVEHLARSREVPRPGDIHLRPPIAGYVGQLSTRIDLELLRSVAAHGHSLLLIGRRRPDLPEARLRELAEMPNVQWLGHRSFDDLPGYLGAMDVGLVPYTGSPFNRASFPLKTLEYLAAGLPVVATDLSALRWLATDLVSVCASHTEFLSAVPDAVAVARDPNATRRRREFAAAHSWDDRARAYLDLIEAAPPSPPR